MKKKEYRILLNGLCYNPQRKVTGEYYISDENKLYLLTEAPVVFPAGFTLSLVFTFVFFSDFRALAREESRPVEDGGTFFAASSGLST
jgi:hypothetical protein